MTDSESPSKPAPKKEIWTIYSTISYAVVMLVIGLPLWWKTTTVERVFLPYYEMHSYKDHFKNNLKIPININIKGFTSKIDEIQNNEKYKFSIQNTQIPPDETELIYKSRDLFEIDQKLCEGKKALKNFTDFQIFHVGRADLLKEHGQKLIFGNCRSAYYISNLSKITAQAIYDAINNLFEGGSNLKALALKGSQYQKTPSPIQLPLSAGYNILISLLIPQPEIMNPSWDIEKSTQLFLDPMLKKQLSTFAEFSIQSQIKYYVKLNINPELNKASRIYEVSHDQLPLVINPVESKLTSFVSQNPAINFLVYIAPCEESPLHLLDQNGLLLKSNSFQVPQWGGIQIYNVECKSNGTYDKTPKLNMGQIHSIIITQLRSLIGLKNEKYLNILDLRNTVLRDWEVDLLVREQLRNLLFTSTNTIKSLADLLDQITNIVIEEEVGEQMKKCIESLKSSFEAGNKGDIQSAQKFAIEAYQASEIAFHHWANLAQLYFPDDQKYAIYIPLFLPVGIPVIISLKNIFNYYKSLKNV